jgi:hypothetical protein
LVQCLVVPSWWWGKKSHSDWEWETEREFEFLCCSKLDVEKMFRFGSVKQTHMTMVLWFPNFELQRSCALALGSMESCSSESIWMSPAAGRSGVVGALRSPGRRSNQMWWRGCTYLRAEEYAFVSGGFKKTYIYIYVCLLLLVWVLLLLLSLFYFILFYFILFLYCSVFLEKNDRIRKISYHFKPEVSNQVCMSMMIHPTPSSTTTGATSSL